MNDKSYKCYCAGPDLFPRVLPDGSVETWEQAERRARKLNEIVNNIPEFEAITPTNTDLASYDSKIQARVCLLKDLFLASHCDIVFANTTSFCGSEPDSGTVVEAVTCALSGKLLVLWADPLRTYEEKFKRTDARPYSPLDDHNNLMLEQLFYLSWELYFGERHATFGNLVTAAKETARQIRRHGLKSPGPILFDRLHEIGFTHDLPSVVQQLLDLQQHPSV